MQVMNIGHIVRPFVMKLFYSCCPALQSSTTEKKEHMRTFMHLSIFVKKYQN